MGALRLPFRQTEKNGSLALADAVTYLAIVVFTLALAAVLGERPVVPMAAVGFGMLLLGWMTYSARYELTLAVLAAYLLLADGYLKLRFQGDLSVVARDALLFAITFGALARWLAQHERVRLPALSGWVLAWVVLILAQLANPANGTLLHSVLALRPHIEFVPLFFLGYAVMRTRARLIGFLWLLLVLAAINGFVGFLQLNLTPAELADWGPGYRAKIYGTETGISGRGFLDATGELRTRPFALGSDQGFGGAVGVLAAPAALALFAVVRRARIVLLAGIVLAVGTALAVISSQARVAVLGALAALGVYVLLGTAARRRLATIATVAVGALFVWLAVSAIAGGSYAGVFERYATISPDRVVTTAFEYRKDTLAIIPTYAADFPLGAGLGTVGPGGSTPGGNGRILNGESQYTFLLIEAGVVGLLVMTLFNLRLLHLVATRVRRHPDPDIRLLLAAIGAPLFAKFLSWFGGAATAGVPDSPYLWFAAGILAWWLVDARASAAGHRAW